MQTAPTTYPAPSPARVADFDALLEVTRLVGAGAPRPAVVRAVAQAVSAGLGFRTAVVNLHRPGTDDFVVAEVVGASDVRAAMVGTTSSWGDWDALLDPRFESYGAYFLPAGIVDWSEHQAPTVLSPTDGPGAPDAWHAEDALLAPLRGAGGRILGFLSVDEPRSGRRPADGDLAILAALGGHLGAALEMYASAEAAEFRSTALERLARTSAAALGTLDLDTALDEVCAAVAEGLDFASVEVGLVEGDRVIVRHAVGADRRLDGLSTTELDSILAGGSTAEGCYLLHATVSKPVDCTICRLQRPDGALLGVLRAADPGEGPLPASERRRLLRTFASQVEATLASAAHAAVRESEALNSAILAASLDVILTMDAEGRLVEFNPAAERTFGYRREDVLGREMAELVIPERLRPAHRKGHRAWTPGTPSTVVGKRIEVPAMRADGSEFPCEIAVVAIDRDGPPLLTAYLRDISDRVAAREALERERDSERHLARHDVLTGLPNRMAVLERLDARLADVVAAGGAIAAVSVGLGGLQLVTDSFGGALGDRLVCAAADRLTAAWSDRALVARPDGAGFLLLLDLDAPDPGAAAAVAEAVFEQLSGGFEIDALELHADPVVGHALLEELADPGDLLRRADVARNRGRVAGDLIRGYDAAYDDSRRKLATLTALRGAVGRNELELHYQPLWRVEDGSLAGVEALLRWRRDGELVPPGDFIELAETSGLMVPIGEWVIDEACRQASAWTAAGLVAPIVGVNVSPHQLPGTDLPAVVAAALDRHGVAPEKLCIEVTESAIEAGDGEMVAALHALGEMGVHCALDDFGAEHSSLTRLASLPVRTVKLDRGFLRRVPGDTRANRLLRAIVGIAEALSMRTVAEGIEEDDQLTALRVAGVEIAQGFLLARPEPADVVAARLAPSAPAS